MGYSLRKCPLEAAQFITHSNAKVLYSNRRNIMSFLPALVPLCTINNPAPDEITHSELYVKGYLFLCCIN